MLSLLPIIFFMVPVKFAISVSVFWTEENYQITVVESNIHFILNLILILILLIFNNLKL